MPYASGRVYHDADSHIMEPRDWLQEHATAEWRDRMPLLGTSAIGEPEICMFSSDYPHVEGGRNPLKRFGESLANCTDEEVERFYSLNMVDLMGASMPVSLPAEEFPSCRTP